MKMVVFQAKNSKPFVSPDKIKRKMKRCITLSGDTYEPLRWAVADPVVDASLVWRSTVQAPSIDVQNQQWSERCDAGSDKNKLLVSLQ